MKNWLKPLEDQAVVVTGATSGIGLAITEQAVRRGATVVAVTVAVARNAEGLAELRARLTADCARIEICFADVADPAAVERITDHPLRKQTANDSARLVLVGMVWGASDDAATYDEQPFYLTGCRHLRAFLADMQMRRTC